MKRIDHNKYPQGVKKLSRESLRYIIADCQLALKAMPDSENSGYYLDEINYCSMEIASRK